MSEPQCSSVTCDAWDACPRASAVSSVTSSTYEAVPASMASDASKADPNSQWQVIHVRLSLSLGEINKTHNCKHSHHARFVFFNAVICMYKGWNVSQTSRSWPGRSICQVLAWEIYLPAPSFTETWAGQAGIMLPLAGLQGLPPLAQIVPWVQLRPLVASSLCGIVSWLPFWKEQRIIKWSRLDKVGKYGRHMKWWWVI